MNEIPKYSNTLPGGFSTHPSPTSKRQIQWARLILFHLRSASAESKIALQLLVGVPPISQHEDQNSYITQIKERISRINNSEDYSKEERAEVSKLVLSLLSQWGKIQTS